MRRCPGPEVAAAGDSLFQFEQKFLAALSAKEGGAYLRSDLIDLKFKFYRDTWATLPAFETLRAERRAIGPQLCHPQTPQADRTRWDWYLPVNSA